MYTVKSLFDLTHTLAAFAFEKCEYPWDVLLKLDEIVLEIGKTLDETQYNEALPNVWVHNTAKIAPSACIQAPCVIGAESEIRHGAFIRGNALIGQNCVVGNSVEIKNAILFDNVQVCHFNYVGDSVLGYCAHMGAGAITSNVRLDYKNVMVRIGDEKIDTYLMKLGALLGDHAEVGCNSVLNPGTIIGKHAKVYPLTQVRGCVPENTIVKNEVKVMLINNEASK